MKKIILEPTGNVKSFYNKAYILEDEEGNATLYSYETPIIRRNTDGSLTRLYNGWTATTGRHIKAFCNLTKQEFLKIKMEG